MKEKKKQLPNASGQVRGNLPDYEQVEEIKSLSLVCIVNRSCLANLSFYVFCFI